MVYGSPSTLCRYTVYPYTFIPYPSIPYSLDFAIFGYHPILT